MTWRLTLLLTCLALATSRVGLVAHELVGHGGVALACGGNITQVKLFWFAGGWIRYDGVDGPCRALAVTLGGMAVEVLIGAVLWAVVRGDSLGHRLVRGIGAAAMIHAGFYFAAGAWHGYGDGALLYHDLGDARYPVAIVAGLLVCAMTFIGARWIAGAIAAAAPRWGMIVALVAAAGINIGLDVGELAVRTDRTYSATMAHENERIVARELAQIERDTPLAPDQRALVRERLEDENREFPFRWLLAAGVVIGFSLGVWRSPRRERFAVPDRLLARAAAVALASLAVVIALSVVM